MILTRNEEAQVAVTQNSSDTDQTRTTSRNDAHVLPCVLRFPPLAVVLIVQLGDCLPQRFDTGRRTVLTTMAGDVDLLGPLEAALDLIVDLGSALSQICPCVRVL